MSSTKRKSSGGKGAGRVAAAGRRASGLITTGLIARECEPQNLEFPFSTLDGFITQNESFYVRNHFPDMPELKAGDWKLKVEGEVNDPLKIGYRELVKMPSHTMITTIECAGNSRVFLTPKKEGVQWELGAVGMAEWTGVPLKAVLERVGVKHDAVEVVLEDADLGEIKDPPKSPGEIHFTRSLPIQKAFEGDVLLAYRMNGDELSQEHSYPVRAIVPG